MISKINKTLEYYEFKRAEIVEFVNSSNGLTVEKIIEFGEELAILEYKITALQIAKEN